MYLVCCGQMSVNAEGQVFYEVESRGNVTRLSPQDVGSYVLQNLRHTAERNLSGAVRKAVMSVPAEFNEKQRNFTRLAARKAGW